MRWRMVLACLLAGPAVQAWAGDIAVRLVDSSKHPVDNAVVTLVDDRAAAPSAMDASPARDATTRYVDQRDETFVPYVQVVRPGDRVVFRNSDHTRHHVYSFSPVKAFEFMLRPGTSSPPLVLQRSGLLAVGCNIHDHMIAYLVVTGLPAEVSGADGEVTFHDVAPGHYTIHVWHPRLRPGQAEPVRAVTVGAGAAASATASFTLALISDPRDFNDREHLDY